MEKFKYNMWFLFVPVRSKALVQDLMQLILFWGTFNEDVDHSQTFLFFASFSQRSCVDQDGRLFSSSH